MNIPEFPKDLKDTIRQQQRSRDARIADAHDIDDWVHTAIAKRFYDLGYNKGAADGFDKALEIAERVCGVGSFKRYTLQQLIECLRETV